MIEPGDDGCVYPDPPIWDDFAMVQDRLKIAVDQFNFSVQYVPISLNEEQQHLAANLAIECVVAALRDEPECPLTALRVDSGVQTGDGATYFVVSFLNPVFDFALRMGPTEITLLKVRTTLRNLVLTTRILARIAQGLFPVGESMPQLVPTFSTRGIPLQPVRLVFSWKYRLELGARMSDGSEATNLELFQKLVRHDAPTGSNLSDWPLAALEADGIRRGDVTMGFTKVLEGRRRLLWITYEGPWNVTRKDVDLQFDYQLGEGDSPIEIGDFGDFRTPFISFYRDLILQRFLTDLFSTVKVSGRP